MKYHSQGINKYKKIREQRKNPLPLGLMKCKDSKISDLPRMKIDLSGISLSQLKRKE